MAWERLIGLTKRCLRKSLGRSLLDEETLATVLVGIEASLNSRPLIYEHGENDTEEALTPSHFLTGRKLTTVPSGPELKGDKLTNIYRKQQDVLDMFWKRWTKEYLLELRSHHQVKNVRQSPRVRVGDLVLLQEDVLLLSEEPITYGVLLMTEAILSSLNDNPSSDKQVDYGG
ncbi:uncharacterized protein [Parasteatoda tepidariorum]|uniref:uncharacterized protein n=1 Tax=Parasteatoda tepidariorum TaxID=114398 RepID=UPI001C7234BA|nr:uncharacterized protein LOC122268768 [Parasteatoda tepidariorum]